MEPDDLGSPSGHLIELTQYREDLKSAHGREGAKQPSRIYVATVDGRASREVMLAKFREAGE